MKNFTDFIAENKDTIFRYLVLNKYSIWTPEQQEKKYCDESVYIDDHYEYAKITDVIETPKGLILELDIYDPDDRERLHRKDYRPISDITLERFDIDNNGVEDE